MCRGQPWCGPQRTAVPPPRTPCRCNFSCARLSGRLSPQVAPFSAVEPSTGEKASRQGARRPGTKGKQQRQGAETNRHRKAQARISAHACSVTSPADTSGQAGVHQARDGATGLRAGESRMADGAPQMAGREEGCTGLPGHARLTPGTPSRRKPNQDVKSAHR